VVIIVLVYLGAAGFLGVLLANVLDDDIANRVMHIAEPLSTCVLVGWILLHPTRGRGRRFTPHIGDDA